MLLGTHVLALRGWSNEPRLGRDPNRLRSYGEDWPGRRHCSADRWSSNGYPGDRCDCLTNCPASLFAMPLIEDQVPQMRPPMMPILSDERIPQPVRVLAIPCPKIGQLVLACARELAMGRENRIPSHQGSQRRS